MQWSLNVRGRFRIFMNFLIFLRIPSVGCILLGLFKRTRQSTPFSCYTATATGQHGKRELPDEDFARVLRGLHRARHQLRLLQISSSSRPAPLDHSHSHWVRKTPVKMNHCFEQGSSLIDYFLTLNSETQGQFSLIYSAGEF